MKLPKTKDMPNLSLTGYNDIFASTTETVLSEPSPINHSPTDNSERVVEISLAELHPPEFHPFHVNEVICCKGYKIRTYYNIGSYAICGTNGSINLFSEEVLLRA